MFFLRSFPPAGWIHVKLGRIYSESFSILDLQTCCPVLRQAAPELVHIARNSRYAQNFLRGATYHISRPRCFRFCWIA